MNRQPSSDGSMQISAVGIPWYSAETYPRIREVMSDRHLLPPTFESWLRQAEVAEQQIKRSGKTTVRAFVDPDAFVNWCRQRGLNVDAQARMRYASTVAYEVNRKSSS